MNTKKRTLLFPQAITKKPSPLSEVFCPILFDRDRFSKFPLLSSIKNFTLQSNFLGSNLLICTIILLTVCNNMSFLHNINNQNGIENRAIRELYKARAMEKLSLLQPESKNNDHTKED